MKRRAGTALVAVSGFDLLCVLIGGFSLLAAADPVTPWGLAVRLALFFALFALRFRTLAAPGQALSRAHLLFVLLLMPTLQQFQFAGGRTGGDGITYYVYVRSLWKDGDIHFANEYEHYGYQSRADLMMPTSTGHRRSLFSIGPAVLWTPFFGLGEGIGRLQRALTGAADLSGYGPVHVNACSLGSLLYGFALVLLIHDLARRHFAPGLALLAALFTWGGTFLHWYMVQQPLMAHAVSGCITGFVVWLWDRQRAQPSAWGHARLGLALGLAMATRWQSGLLLLLPGFDLAARLWQGRSRAVPGVARHGLALGAAVLIGAFPQMAAWKTLYDEWLLTSPPHGVGWLRLWRLFPLEMFWSSRHGLFAWTPVFLPAFVGLVPLVRRRPALAAPLVPIVLLTTWVNAGAGDWWAGGSYSLRRFDPLLLPLALGLAALLERAQEWVRRRPQAAALLLLGPAALWSALLTPGDERRPAHFPQVARDAWARMAAVVGSPQTWPACWLFAWRTGLSPAAHDLAVGRYLFYQQANLRGRVELGGAQDDGGLLAEGFGPPVHEAGAEARAVTSRARVLAPLDLPETLTVRVRVLGPAALSLSVNGRDLGRATVADAGWSEAVWRAEAAAWRRDLNDVVVETHAGPVLVDFFQFVPEPRLVSAALVALGLLALLATRRTRRGSALPAAALWLVGTPLLDLALRGPWPAALAFAIAAAALRLPRLPAAARAGFALATGFALAWPVALEPGQALAGGFAVPDGLFVRSPLLWVALIGGGLAGRAPAAAGALGLALAVAAPPASALRGVALALLFAGFAAAVAALAGALRRHPARALVAVGLALTTWNLLSMESVRRGLVPRDDTVAFADLAGHNAEVLHGLVGTPLAFPASAGFALRHGLSPARWDRLAEAFAFEPWPGLGSEIDLAAPEAEVDGLLGGGWGSRVPCPPVSCRNLVAEAVVHFRLRRATRLSLSIEARGPGAIAVALDGRELGRLVLDGTLSQQPLRLQERLPAGLRRLTLRPLDGSRPRVSRVVFVAEER